MPVVVPRWMRAYLLPANCRSIDDLRQVERPELRPEAGQIVVRVRAVSINSRDQAVAAGTYVGGALNRDTIPLSDGAGEVISVGANVTQFKPGDRVAATFFQVPPHRPPLRRRMGLGSTLNGTLAEQSGLDE